MATTLNERDFGRALSEIIERVRDGERFVIERDGEKLAVLSPPPSEPPGITGQELTERIGHLFMPGDGFADDVEAGRASLVPARIPPWPE